MTSTQFVLLLKITLLCILTVIVMQHSVVMLIALP